MIRTLMQVISHKEKAVRAGAIVLLTLGVSLQSFAALGGTLDSVESDQSHMKASVKVTTAGTYTIHELKASSGTTIREYVSSDGRVFGVTWEGPFIPDMQQLLGTYFEQYAKGVKAQREAHVGRRPLNIEMSNLIVQASGHMRAFYGRAYDPGLLPAGIGADDIR
jgi:hypothetical protein